MSAAPIPFARLQGFFQNEDEFGQLCDIAAPDADRRAWAVFLNRVVPAYPHRFSLSADGGEGVVQPVPSDGAAVLRNAQSESGPWPSLELDVHGLNVRVLFFGEDTLELDVMRTEVDERGYLGLAALMERMGDEMRVDVFMTPESLGAEGVMVYAAEEKRFRPPRRGAGTDGRVRDHVLGKLRGILMPLSEPLRGRGARGPVDGSLERALVDATRRIDELTRIYRELVMQDELTIDERRVLQKAWSVSATIVSPAPGSGVARFDPYFVSELGRLACEVCGSGQRT